MNYKERLARMRNAASSEYHNANGNIAVQALDPTDRTITVTIDPIATSAAGKARIFGYNISDDESYNTANNTTVDIPESSHGAVKRDSAANPFRIKGILYTVSVAGQLDKPFNIIKQTTTGAENKRVWQPKKFTSPRNYNPLQIETSALQAVIDGNTRIDIDFLAGATASMVLEISDKTDVSQVLSQRPVVKSVM